MVMEKRVQRISKLTQLQPEEEYVELVDYHIRILTRFTDSEVDFIRDCLRLIESTEDFFGDVFYRLYLENKSVLEAFDGLEDISKDTFKYNERVKKHAEQVLDIMRTVVNNIKSPRNCVQEILKASAFHKLFKVKSVYFQAFKNTTINMLKESIDDEEIFTADNEEVLQRFLDCIIVLTNQNP